MKHTKQIIALMIALITLSFDTSPIDRHNRSELLYSSTSPGGRYTFKYEAGGVKVYYRWKRNFPLFQPRGTNLELYLANENSYRVSVSFMIDVYKNALLEYSSDSLNYCIPPNYEINGRFRHLAFDPDLIPDDNQEAGSDHFFRGKFQVSKWFGTRIAT